MSGTRDCVEDLETLPALDQAHRTVDLSAHRVHRWRYCREACEFGEDPLRRVPLAGRSPAAGRLGRVRCCLSRFWCCGVVRFWRILRFWCCGVLRFWRILRFWCGVVRFWCGVVRFWRILRFWCGVVRFWCCGVVRFWRILRFWCVVVRFWCCGVLRFWRILRFWCGVLRFWRILRLGGVLLSRCRRCGLRCRRLSWDRRRWLRCAVSPVRRLIPPLAPHRGSGGRRGPPRGCLEGERFLLGRRRGHRGPCRGAGPLAARGRSGELG